MKLRPILVLVLVAAVCLVASAWLVLRAPTIEYDEGYTTTCLSPWGALSERPTVYDQPYELVEGQDLLDQLREDARDKNLQTPDAANVNEGVVQLEAGRVRDKLAADCGARHTELLARSLLLGLVGLLAASAAMVLTRRPKPPRPGNPGAYVPPSVPSG